MLSTFSQDHDRTIIYQDTNEYGKQSPRKNLDFAIEDTSALRKVFSSQKKEAEPLHSPWHPRPERLTISCFYDIIAH